MRIQSAITASLILAMTLLGCSDTTQKPLGKSRDSHAEDVPVESDDKAPRIAPVTPAPPAQPPPTQKRERLYIQLLGENLTPAFFEDMKFVKTAIEAFYRMEVRILPAIPLPEKAWYAPRRRYRAESLLGFLEKIRPEDGNRMMGITTKDISTTKGKHKDWGILGLATIDGTVCVVSTFRTNDKKSEEPWKKLRARYRFAKTVVHELGHNFGLEHCPNKGCIMEDAKGTVVTTDREYTLCDDCRASLNRYSPGILVQEILPPWPIPNEK
jgi:archaemetzincin